MFFSTVIYVELFVAFFFLPGFFITVILGIKKFRFLLSFALSYSLLILTLLPFEYYAQPISRWSAWIQWEWIILAVLAVAKMFINPRNLSVSIRGLFNPRLLVPLALAAIICGYLAYAGPYLEIPADVWEHVNRSQWMKLSVIDNECFPSGQSLEYLLLPRNLVGRYYGYWDFIRAWLCHVSGLAIMDSFHVLTFANVLIFLLAIYYFGLFLFAGLRISVFKKMIMAAVASLFAAATMGNMVFAYIRYYAFASTILDYVLFLAAMAVIITWMRSNHWLGHALWIAPVLIIVTNMVHTQEVLFVFFMTLALSIVESGRLLWRKIFSQRGQVICGNGWTVREWKPVILAAFLLLVFFAGFAAVRYFKPGAWISSNLIMPHVAIPPDPVNFIFRNLMISPPQNFYLRLVVYQLFIFYQVVGCWGLFVGLLFLLMIRHFAKIPYLTAGVILVPLLTAFNPLIIDMMARMGQDMTLYRFHYLIPLPFVGGYLFIYFWGKAREWFRRMRLPPAESGFPIWPRLSWVNFLGSMLVMAGLIGLVFPINAAGIYAPYSKIYTLRKLPAGNDYHLCDDLGKIMAKYENKVILTDDWTAKYLRYYSQKNTYSYVKWLNSSDPEKEPPEPYAWESLRNSALIVINRRNGCSSITGRIAKHWPEDVIPKVSRYYSLEAQYYLESHPEKFRKIWAQNRIAVYAVR